MYWTPKRLKELKERGFKLRHMTLEEANAEAEEQAASVKRQAVQDEGGKHQGSSRGYQAP